MKFVINRDLFSKALSRIQGVLSRRASLPVLSNVRLEVNTDGKLKIGATDLDVTYDGELACRSGQSGTVTVDGKRLFEVVRSLPGEEVDIEVSEESKITIRCKNAEFMLLGTPSDTYPTLPDAHGVKLFPVDGIVLRELLE